MIAQTMREEVGIGSEYGYRSWQTPPRIPSCPTWILFAVLLASASWAQKAKPMRITLEDGAATVEGRLHGRQETDYEATAGPSTTLTLQLLTVPANTVALKLYAPEGAEMPLRAAGSNRWTAALPHSGDYGISVVRISFDHGTSAYKLKVRIR
jgi:hypothetical protein